MNVPKGSCRPVRVALGVIKNKANEILLANRGKGSHLAGYWEFPGGKVEEQESFKMALRRELLEEVGIQVERIQKIIEFVYSYDDRRIHFQVFKVFKYYNRAVDNEGQRLDWVHLNELHKIQLPPANKMIINALHFPSLYMIADQQYFENDLLINVEQRLVAGIKLIQYRAHQSNRSEYVTMAKSIRELCDRYGAMMICNCELEWVEEITPHGVHLTSSRLAEVVTTAKHIPSNCYFSASCHSREEVELANQLAVQCILIGPVHHTNSHQNARNLEWEGFNKLCSFANMPAYALGGVSMSERQVAIAYGAQGIAGIRTFKLH